MVDDELITLQLRNTVLDGVCVCVCVFSLDVLVSVYTVHDVHAYVVMQVYVICWGGGGDSVVVVYDCFK